jgi:hypothetical protein
MKPRMSPNELSLFQAVLKKSSRYLEFGTGGSTFLASSHVKSWIISIDSSQSWLDTVRDACKPNPVQPQLILADIGPTGEWGNPTDPETRARWPDYHTNVWSRPESMDADLYFIDGRFRIACFAQIVLHCGPNAIIGFHDFKSRPHYHRVLEISREIAEAEDLTFFLPLPWMRERAISILKELSFTPA